MIQQQWSQRQEVATLPISLTSLTYEWNKSIAAQPMETLQLKDLHHIKGAFPQKWRTTKSTSWAPQRIDSYRTEVEDIYMPNKACKSIPQLRRVPSHKLKITAWQKIHTKTARKSIAQLRRDPSHSEVFHMHRDERHCKLYEGTVKASNTSHGMSYRHHSSYTYYYIFSKA